VFAFRFGKFAVFRSILEESGPVALPLVPRVVDPVHPGITADPELQHPQHGASSHRLKTVTKVQHSQFASGAQAQ
jgi:hypothetical protein